MLYIDLLLDYNDDMYIHLCMWNWLILRLVRILEHFWLQQACSHMLLLYFHRSLLFQHGYHLEKTCRIH